MTTQQKILKKAHKGEKQFKKAVAYASYRPILFEGVKDRQKVSKKAIYIEEISLKEAEKLLKGKESKKNKDKVSKKQKSSKKELEKKKASKETKNKSKKGKKLSKKKKKAKKARLRAKIAQSTKRNTDVVAEPIAEQLVAQGYIEKAIKMYEQLGLIIPEKSSYFAALISNLKKEI